MTLRTLIVDDAPIAPKVLREELGSFADVEIIGEADNGAVALEKICADHPDLVLLDLQKPEMGGLEVVLKLKRGRHVDRREDHFHGCHRQQRGKHGRCERRHLDAPAARGEKG
jgi:CheY-like chemotaxis protein